MRPLAVLRPEPGNARTAARVTAAGATAIRLPLFVVRPLPWAPPPAAAFDALLLTSANAVRHAGTDLARYAALPVLAVGAATAAAARAAGLTVAATGTADAAALVAGRTERLLHLAGRDHVARADIAAIPVYAAEPLAIDAAAIDTLAGSVVLLHSARAAARLATLVPPANRAQLRLAALAPAVAAAAGRGWAAVAAAARPRDETLVALALRLAD